VALQHYMGRMKQMTCGSIGSNDRRCLMASV